MNIQQAWRITYQAARVLRTQNIPSPVLRLAYKPFRRALDIALEARDELAAKAPGEVLLRQRWRRSPRHLWSHPSAFNCRCEAIPIHLGDPPDDLTF